MRMIDYVMDLDEDGYKVMSRAPSKYAYFPQTTLPIRLEVIGCRSKNTHKDVDITELIDRKSYIDDMDDMDFWGNYQDIVHGKDDKWILVEFQPLIDGIGLTYLNLTTDQEKIATVNLSGKEIGSLGLYFYVPHSNGKPDTIYNFRLSCSEDSQVYYGSCAECTPNSYYLMAYTSDNQEDPLDPIPKHVKITEYTDF